MEGPRAPEMLPTFLGASLERPWSDLGGLLGWFWRSGVILGSVLGCQNVVISLVLNVFLRCHVFSYIFRSDVVFLKTNERKVVMLILGVQMLLFHWI